MIQRLSMRDVAYFLILGIGFVAGIFHFAGGRPANGIIVILAVGAGVVLRVEQLRHPRPPQSSTGDARQPSSQGGSEKSPSNQQLEPDDRDSWLRDGVIAGFAATIAMTLVLITGYILAGAFGEESGNTLQQWLYGLTHNSVTDGTFDIPVGAYGVNLVAGLVWALLYVAIFEPRLPGSGWQRGMIFSLLPWLLSLVVFLPLVGAGFFGLDLDAGVLPIIGNLILHLVYGAVLGYIYALSAVSGIEEEAEDPLTTWSARWEDRGLAVGMIVGLILGIIAGSILGIVVDDDLLGPFGITLTSAAIGVGIGAFIGPLIGLEYGERHYPIEGSGSS